MQLQMQASEMQFLRKIKGVTIVDNLRDTAIRKSLNIESLLLWAKRSQLRWFGHISRMRQGRLPQQSFCAKMSGRGELDGYEQDGLVISRILVGTVLDFIQTKCSLCWRIESVAALSGAAAPATLKKKRVKKKELLISVSDWNTNSFAAHFGC